MLRLLLVALVARCGSGNTARNEEAACGQRAESLLQSRVSNGQFHQFPADDDDTGEAEEEDEAGGAAHHMRTSPHKVMRPNMSKGFLDGRVNRTGGEAPIVEFALYLNNMDHVNSRTNQVMADVILKSRYRIEDFGRNAHVSTELVNGKVDFRNEVRRWEDEGNITVTEHLYVTIFFDGRYDLFPFDMQTIVVAVQLKGMTSTEARFDIWPGFSGIRPMDNATGYQFQTQQYYPKSWHVSVKEHHEFGMPYNKSRGELHVIVGRRLPFYVMTCSVIPSMAIIFAIFAFCLPITLIVPRVTISFTSFLAMFVHVKQMTTMVPDGVWCWLMTDLLFFCTILGAAITSNMLSAKLHATAKKEEAPLSEMHDGFIRLALPAEFLVGQAIISFGPLRALHRYTGPVCVGSVICFHTLTLYRFYVHMKPDYKGRPFMGGLSIVFPFLFRITDASESMHPHLWFTAPRTPPMSPRGPPPKSHREDHHHEEHHEAGGENTTGPGGAAAADSHHPGGGHGGGDGEEGGGGGHTDAAGGGDHGGDDGGGGGE